VNIALCLSGQSRHVEEGYNLFKKNLVNFDTMDVFVHTWEDNEFEKIKKLYNPVSCIIEPQRHDICFGETELNYKQSPASSGNFVHYSMFYSIFMSNLLKKQHEKFHDKYDCVIRSRTDVALLETLDVSLCELDRVIATDSCNNPKVISDWFNFSSSDLMDIYTDAYFEIPNLKVQKVNVNSGEEIITNHLLNEKIEMAKLSVDLKLIRPFKTNTRGWIYDKELEQL
jgi:hypothetical protein